MILVAPDSFKGSLSAAEAARAIGMGIRDLSSGAVVTEHPISDGGEGMMDVLLGSLSGTVQVTEVAGPVPGSRVNARWGLSGDGHVAIIEMAQAAGLTLVPANLRDPRQTSTKGVGELIKAALEAGATSLLVGIGGSATNDGGAGMAEALGVRFLDANGRDLLPGGAALHELHSIDTSGIDQRLRSTEVVVACDVQNPLVGPDGASAVYAPQKGASRADVSNLDAALQRYREVLLESTGVDVQQVPGSGAAGGLGAGLLVFCRATLKRGIDLILDATGFDRALLRASLVVTGEGRIDRQLGFGKALAGVLDRARKTGKPVVAVVGTMEGRREEFTGPASFLDLITLVNESTTTQQAMRDAAGLVRLRSFEIMQRIQQQFPETFR